MDSVYQFIPKPGVARFFQKERESNVRYLVKRFAVTEEMANEAFCEGCHALLNNIHEGRLTAENLSCSLQSYLTSCCRNQLLKLQEKRKRLSGRQQTEDDVTPWETDMADESRVNDDGDLVSIAAEQHESDLRLMEKIVIDLPFPCEDLIWGKFRDKFSPAEMAARLGYSGPRVAITTMSRCMKKLKKRFEKERKLING